MKNSDLPDAAAREAALDPRRSFIVQAPAGSGKTELLVRRFLKLLATANIHSPEDLIKTPIESLATTTGIDMGDLARLRQRAISWLSEASS